MGFHPTAGTWLKGFRMIAIATVCGWSVPSAFSAPSWLTADEQAWLDEHDDELVIGSDSNYRPYVFLDEHGHLSGYWGDATARIGQMLGVRFRVEPSETFNALLDAARQREISVIPCLLASEERRAFLLFTRPLIAVEDILITRNDSQVSAVDDLGDVLVGYVDGYTVGDELQGHVPAGNMRPVKSEADGLQQLALGEIDVLVADAGVASWHAQRLGLSSLRFAGTLGLGTSNVATMVCLV